uniref:Uncharacterized protein n=1 Tax=Plectus sambesii TaxID=2011161 RepID=A0A914VN78_9BILA
MRARKSAPTSSKSVGTTWADDSCPAGAGTEELSCERASSARRRLWRRRRRQEAANDLTSWAETTTLKKEAVARGGAHRLRGGSGLGDGQRRRRPDDAAGRIDCGKLTLFSESAPAEWLPVADCGRSRLHSAGMAAGDRVGREKLPVLSPALNRGIRPPSPQRA